MTAITESDDYFGILNAVGDFWTTRVFVTEFAARNHIVEFWGKQSEQAAQCLRTHRVVPVTIKIMHIEAKK